MNLLEKLKSFGAEFEPNFLEMGQSQKFVLDRNAGMYMEFLYTVKYNRLPSTMFVEYKHSRFEELAKDVLAEGFKIVGLKSQYNRHSKESIIFANPEKSIVVEMNNNEDDNPFSVQSLQDRLFGKEDVEDSEDDSLTTGSFTICYDPSVNFEIPFKLKEKYTNVVDSKNSKGKILFFEKDQYGEMILTPHKVKNYDLDISENYNDDFLEVHDKIQNWVGDFSSKNNKLILLHGAPGSGKTNYIKYLLQSAKDVKKIYIPPYFVQSIADPAFLPIIKREKESLLIIEDAEKILIKREESADNSLISILLNLCDGIMADVLNFKIIATFNTDEDNIDTALTRKGRTFLKYKFDALSEEKTRKLFHKVHGNYPPKKSMTLAEIYNDENNFSKPKEVRRMGFGQ